MRPAPDVPTSLDRAPRARRRLRPLRLVRLAAAVVALAAGVLTAPVAARSVVPEPRADEAPARMTRIERRVGAMGTWLTLVVEHETRAEALAASEAALRAILAVEERLSTWRAETELSRLNAAPVGEPVPLSAALLADLRHARELWSDTGGAFDPAVGRFVPLWGLRTGGARPDEDELVRVAARGGFATLELDGGSAIRRDPALVLEEGGFGKGVGLDAAREALRAHGVRSAALDLGGQVLVVGDELQAFLLAHPSDRERAVVELSVERGSFATSGNVERAVTVDGERIGHVLDPRTGRPASDFGSVTVWARDATTADALSTALFVMGPDGALAWASEHDGVEALVLEARPDGLALRATAGLRGRLRALEELDVELVTNGGNAATDPSDS